MKRMGVKLDETGVVSRMIVGRSNLATVGQSRYYEGGSGRATTFTAASGGEDAESDGSSL